MTQPEDSLKAIVGEGFFASMRIWWHAWQAYALCHGSLEGEVAWRHSIVCHEWEPVFDWRQQSHLKVNNVVLS